MKQQVVIIHGGETFATEEDYLDNLKNREVELDNLRPKSDWKSTIAQELGGDMEVFVPRMPNGSNAKYREWKIWWERLVPLWQEGVILIGHSLGGIFLAKYLAENDWPGKIKATILVAAPFEEVSGRESLADFTLPKSLEKFNRQGGQIYLFQSLDDPVVPIGQIKKYQAALPTAQSNILPRGGHLNEEYFPELVKVLKSLAGCQ